MSLSNCVALQNHAENVEEQVNISWQLRVAAATALGLIRPLKTLEAKLKMASVGPRNTSSKCLEPFRNLSVRACIVNHASISLVLYWRKTSKAIFTRKK